MRNIWKKFALLTVVGSLLCTALVAGCGGDGGDDTDTNATTNNATGGGDAAE